MHGFNRGAAAPADIPDDVEDRGQTDRVTVLSNPTLTLILDLDFQSSASCGHDPHTSKNQGQKSGGSKVRAKMDGHDRFYYFPR